MTSTPQQAFTVSRHIKIHACSPGLARVLTGTLIFPLGIPALHAATAELPARSPLPTFSKPAWPNPETYLMLGHFCSGFRVEFEGYCFTG